MIKKNQGHKQQGFKELKLNYKFDETTEMIGSGSFGKVFKSHNTSDPSIKVAIKVINKDLMSDNLCCLMDEIGIISLLDHPNIVNHIETYDDTSFVYIGK